MDEPVQQRLRIWIDLANSPHVPFFAPIVSDLEAAGHTVALTARDFAQTLQLAEVFGLNVEAIGEHGGGNRLRKIANIAGRALALRRFGRAGRFDLAISHNSYAHSLASRSLGIPTATMMDFEHQPANHLAFRFAHLVIVPSVFPESILRKQGAREQKVYRYEGLKEEVYLQDYKPDTEFPARLAACAQRAGKTLGSEDILITVRPPATMAAYHRFENPVFIDLLNHLGRFDRARLFVFPRTPAQREEIEPHLPANALIPDESFDGRHLIYSSDLVVSAGGTMNREAAVLGTPVYSVFAGRRGAIDDRLIATRRMVMIETTDDLAKIHVEKKPASPVEFAFGLRAELIQKCLELAHSRRKGSRRE